LLLQKPDVEESSLPDLVIAIVKALLEQKKDAFAKLRHLMSE
jgi:hypothetical protein